MILLIAMSKENKQNDKENKQKLIIIKSQVNMYNNWLQCSTSFMMVQQVLSLQHIHCYCCFWRFCTCITAGPTMIWPPSKHSVFWTADMKSKNKKKINNNNTTITTKHLEKIEKFKYLLATFGLPLSLNTCPTGIAINNFTNRNLFYPLKGPLLLASLTMN